MSIDAHLPTGIIDDKTAQLRCPELKEKSSFLGSMDGASKFVHGDATAGLMVTVTDTVGDIEISYFHHDMCMGETADVSTNLSASKDVVTQIPPIILLLTACMAAFVYVIPIRHNHRVTEANAKKQDVAADRVEEEKNSLKASLATAEIELPIGKRLATRLLATHQKFASRMSKIRKKFATQYGFVVPKVRVTDDFSITPKSYQIKVHGTVVAG